MRAGATSESLPWSWPAAQADGRGMTVRRTIRIVNQRGLHARASRKLAELALSFDTTRIFVKRDDEEADARSLMDLMLLGAGFGQDVEVETRGPHAEDAMAAVEALFSAKFHEDE